MYTTKYFSHQSGFIALMSIIILGFVLFVVVLTLGNRSIGTRFLLLDFERKTASYAAAEGCVQVAAVVLSADHAYCVGPSCVPPVPVADVSVGSNNCLIHSVTGSGSQKTIRVSSSVENATTNLEVVWDISLEKIISWKQVPNW